MLAARRIVNEVRVILEKAPWISCLSAIGFSRARHSAVLQALEDLEPLPVTSPTFARQVPVPHAGSTGHKYIRFQPFASKLMRMVENAWRLKNANPTYVMEILYS